MQWHPIRNKGHPKKSPPFPYIPLLQADTKKPLRGAKNLGSGNKIPGSNPNNGPTLFGGPGGAGGPPHHHGPPGMPGLTHKRRNSGHSVTSLTSHGSGSPGKRGEERVGCCQFVTLYCLRNEGRWDGRWENGEERGCCGRKKI